MPRKSTETPSNDLPFKNVPIKKLYLDPQNPRLAEIGLEGGETQEEILLALWKNMAVDEIADSIAASGYFRHEPLIAEQENGRYVVIEGNRRLAAVRLMLDDKLRVDFHATDLPHITPKQKRELETLPVIERKREEVWQFIGFKHVNGPQPWTSYSKAKYVARVHNEFGISLDEIAKTIGDRHATVKRLYRGLMTLEQAEKTGEFRREDRWKKRFSFSHLYTGLDYAGFQKFLGLHPKKGFKPNPIPKRNIENLGELCEWLYGCKPKQKPPVIQSQNPDLKILDEVLLSKNGTAALRQGLPLSIAVNISRGDERLFRESMVSAKQSLGEARGRLLTGYHGETDLLDIAEDIFLLAEKIHEEMQQIFSSRTRKPSKRTH